MKYYMSGISGDAEIKLLSAAGAHHVLVDQFDLAHGLGFPALALDSGAYRAFKNGLTLSTADYATRVRGITRPLDFVVSLDVIGDPVQSLQNWRALKDLGVSSVPVWHYDADQTFLLRYLDEGCPIVGIGGLAGTMRKDSPERKAALKTLVSLCASYPNRFHVFGLNWCGAINELRGGLHSADSSLWLRGRSGD